MASADEEMRIGSHNGHLMLAALQAAPRQAGDPPRRHHADRPRGQRADEPVHPGVREPERRPGHAGRAAGAQPARGAVHHRREPDAGLPAYVAAPAGLAGRPRLRHQRRRDHHADRRPGLRRAGARPAREVPGPQAGPDDRSGPGGARARRHRPDRGRRAVRAEAGRGRPAAARPHDLDHLHRRHDRQPQGRHRPRRVVQHDDQHPARRVGVAGEPALPHVHARSRTPAPRSSRPS